MVLSREPKAGHVTLANMPYHYGVWLQEHAMAEFTPDSVYTHYIVTDQVCACKVES
jgi:hypothetical protein